MRLPLFAFVGLVAALSGCTTVHRTTLTAGGTLGTDGLPLDRHAVAYGGVSVGARTARLGAEAGAEANRRSDRINPDYGGGEPYTVVTTTFQPYLNLTYDVTPLPVRRARLYGLAGVRYLRQSFQSDVQPVHDVTGYGAFTVGAGAGFGPVSLEFYGHVPVGPENRPLNPTTALRVRVAVPLLRFGGR